MKVAAGRRVQITTTCKINETSYCLRSIAIDSLDLDETGRDTNDLCGSGFWYFLQISQFSLNFFISPQMSFFDHSFPVLTISFKSFSIDGCTKECRSFSAISLSDLH